MQRSARRRRTEAGAYALLYTLVAAVAACCPAAAEAEDRLTIPFAPTIGIERHYEVVRSRQRSDGHRLERILEVRSRALVTPLSRNPAGYLYRFVITESEATAPGSTKPGLERLLSRLAALTTGVPLVYQADSRGTPQRLVNAREVRQAFRAMLSELQGLVRSLTQAGVISQVERPNIEVNVRNILGTLATLSDQDLSRNVLKEARLLFAAGGHDFPIGRLERFAPPRGTPGTAGAMPAEGRRGIASLNETKRQAVVEVHMAYDPTQIGAAIAQLVERLSESEVRDRAPGSEEPGPGAFRVTETSRHLVDLVNGEPIALRHRRTTVFGDRRLVEVTRIGRLRP